MPRKRHESEKPPRLDRRSEGKAILTERGFKQKGCKKKDAKTKVSKKKNVPRELDVERSKRQEKKVRRSQDAKRCQKIGLPRERYVNGKRFFT